MDDQTLYDIQAVFARILKGDSVAVFDLISQNERPTLQKAFNYAAERHKGQMRKGALQRPYTDHLLMTWYLVRASGGSLEQQQAALLHDVVEDCRKKDETRSDIIKEIENIFQRPVSQLVEGLTLPFDNEDDAKELEIISKMPKEVKLIKACDNAANLWDSIFDRPQHWSEDRYKYVIQFREHVNKLTAIDGSIEDAIFKDFIKMATENAKPDASQRERPQCPKPKI